MNITVSVEDMFMDVVHEYPDITVHLSLFNAKIESGTISLNEHNAYKWITCDEIPDYKFCPTDEDINNKVYRSSKTKI